MNELHDIALPRPVSWMPSTVGWYVLFAVAAAVAAWAIWTAIRRYHANRYRREALREMDALEAALNGGGARAATATALPRLVKRIALCFSPRAATAELSGDTWLAFLDESYGGSDFTQGAGRLLPTLSYGSPGAIEAISDQQISDLLVLIRRWIRTHHVRV